MEIKKIAIVHEWFTTIGGSENVVEQLLKIFPDAALYGVVDFLKAEDRAFLGKTEIRPTILQKFPFISQKNYRNYLAFMPLAIEQLDLKDYEIVISNCHAVSKGVITGPDQLHISYLHTPMRYAWDMQNAYLENSQAKGLRSLAARIMLHYIRIWDSLAASRPDVLIANSGFIARRIRKFYRRDSHVIYPPVDTDYFSPGGVRGDFYLAASRFVPYKRLDLIIEAFKNLPDKKLVIIGEGPDYQKLSRNLPGNITLMGYQPKEVLRDQMRRCKAFIFAAREDFGILPLEAQACGAPVIAFGQGGALETVRGQGTTKPTGLFFPSQTAAAIQEAIGEFEKLEISAQDCRENALKFSNQRFQKEFYESVEDSWNSFSRG